jgi:hypothetical protein
VEISAASEFDVLLTYVSKDQTPISTASVSIDNVIGTTVTIVLAILFYSLAALILLLKLIIMPFFKNKSRVK